ncbi:hypothetical protein D3C72_1767870 [compost metagenome]
MRLRQLLQQTAAVELELRPGRKFRHDVVIIGVEPFRHFAGVDAAAIAVAGRAAPGHAEIVIERRAF